MSPSTQQSPPISKTATGVRDDGYLRVESDTIFGATLSGIPVSTTHTITGAIAGVGSTTRLSAVKWRVAGRIGWAWILTIPAAATFAALSFLLINLIAAAVSRLT